MKEGGEIWGLGGEGNGEEGEMGLGEIIWCGGRHSPPNYKNIDLSRIYYTPLNV